MLEVLKMAANSKVLRRAAPVVEVPQPQPEPQPQPQPEPSALDTLIAAIAEGVAMVEAKGVDMVDHFISAIPDPILSREELPALDAELEPYRAKEVEAKYRTMVTTIRGCAVLGGVVVADAIDTAENIMEESKVGDVKGRKGNAASLARGIIGNMVDKKLSFEAAVTVAAAGSEGAFLVAKAMLATISKKLGTLSPALATAWDEDTVNAYHEWIQNGAQFL